LFIDPFGIFSHNCAMLDINGCDEDWDLLLSFFPAEWEGLARSSNAVKGLRQDKAIADCLRVLLMHVGSGLSLRETVVRARAAKLAELSDVALLKRLRKSQDWLCQLCRALFAERGIFSPPDGGRAFRLLDATEVKEPGRTGSLWRIHYSLRWPDLVCDYFKLTAYEGKGTGESLLQFPLAAGDFAIADRGYSHASGIHCATRQQAFITVRLNPDGIRMQTQTGGVFPLMERLRTLQRTGQVAEWKVQIPLDGEPPVTARLCVIRKTKAAIALAQAKLRRKAHKQKSQLRAQTLAYAEYVMVLTTFPEPEFQAARVLECYRLRWQVELVFKRFKQIAQLGHVPKHDPVSAKAWLYGKLFVALLTEKIIQEARALSPWGFARPTVSAAA
jgi:hypothetical protein